MASGPITRATKMGLEGAARARDSSPTGAVRDARRATELVTELARTRPQAPMTSLNEPLGPSRALRSLSGELAALKAAGKAAGGTVNDAVLAAVAGMLRTYLGEAGTDLGASVPSRSSRSPCARAGEDAELGNRISTVFVDLPVEVDDPAERIAAVAEITRAVKDSAAVRAGALLAGAAGSPRRCSPAPWPGRWARCAPATSSSPTCRGRSCPSTCPASSCAGCSR